MTSKSAITIIVFMCAILLGIYIIKTATNREPLEDGMVTEPLRTEMVKVTSPLPGERIASPLRVTGQARGNWFFEASFPVKLYDANGMLLATGIATAAGEWMTSEFVPFSATLSFSKPEIESGYLILEKDNPSGLPEHDDSVSLLIRF